MIVTMYLVGSTYQVEVVFVEELGGRLRPEGERHAAVVHVDEDGDEGGECEGDWC